MADVSISWTTHAVNFPASTDLSQYRVSIDGGPSTPAPMFVAFGTTSAVFPGVDPGDYTAHVALSNGDGSHTEQERTAPFTVPVPSVMLDAPDVVNVSIA